MRTVLVAAALAVLSASCAHAEAAKGGLRPTRAGSCVGIPSGWSHTELPAAPSGNCCDANGHCAQYISTTALLRRPASGRT